MPGVDICGIPNTSAGDSRLQLHGGTCKPGCNGGLQTPSSHKKVSNSEIVFLLNAKEHRLHLIPDTLCKPLCKAGQIGQINELDCVKVLQPRPASLTIRAHTHLMLQSCAMQRHASALRQSQHCTLFRLSRRHVSSAPRAAAAEAPLARGLLTQEQVKQFHEKGAWDGGGSTHA